MFPSKRAAIAAIGASALCLLLVKASSAPTDSDTTSASDSGSRSARALSRGEYLARQALSYRGARYRFGGRSSRGFDCSGLTQTVYKKWGLLLPRTSVAQYKAGTAVPKAKMQAGDLVFFKNTYKRGVSHVGIYVGEGRFVHAAGRGKGVIVSSLSDKYYQNHWAGARRVGLTAVAGKTSPAKKAADASVPAEKQVTEPVDNG